MRQQQQTIVKQAIIKSGDVVHGQFVVFNSLGQGGFGAVFEIYDTKRNEVFALKVEFAKADQELGLEMEAGALKRLQHSAYFPRLIESGKYKKCNFVVMQFLGRSLCDLRKACPSGRFTLSTSIRLGAECLKAIESLHASGLLHRDIKPNNFTIGATPLDRRQIYLIDFGLVRKFTSKVNEIRQQRPTTGFRGMKYLLKF